MGPLTPGSRMRGGRSPAVGGLVITSIATWSVHRSPSSSVTVRVPRRQPAVEYSWLTSPAPNATPSMLQVTEAIFFVPGARQAIHSTEARPPSALDALANVGSTVAAQSGGTAPSLDTAISTLSVAGKPFWSTAEAVAQYRPGP